MAWQTIVTEVPRSASYFSAQKDCISEQQGINHSETAQNLIVPRVLRERSDEIEVSVPSPSFSFFF